MTEEGASSEWLGALQHLAGRIAHEIKNPLNAVAVNLEVVRSRCERGGVEPSAVLPFATAAAGELERVSRLVETLLAVSRPAPAAVAPLAAPLVTLYDVIAGAEGGSVTMDRIEGDTGIDIAPDDARAALAAALDTMIGPGVAVRVRVTRDDDRVTVRLAGPRVTPKVPRTVRLREEADGLTLLFPARARGSAQTE
ncbi:MAG: histidine kinase dimerization/phospho-acceptor domain-containing protein [Gemmatimonadaceae bacterium]